MPSYTASPAYQIHCFQRPIATSVIIGSAFTAYDVIGRGARFSPTLAGTNIVGLYLYNAMQCPMEAIHGRQSAWHNVLSAGLIGYVGVGTGRLGVPFVDHYFFYRYPQVSPAMAGFAVYGGIGALFATFGGKPF